MKLLDHLGEFDESPIFAEPVDFKALGLVDYPMVVKHPMDLRTCRKKLRAKKYPSFEQFNRDLLQIWENCRIYNQVGSEIVQTADIMENHQKDYLSSNPVPVVIPQKRPRDEPEPEELSFEFKVMLAEQVRKSSQDVLLKILNIVETSCKNAVKKTAEVVRIKVDKLDKETIEAINQ